MGQRGSAIIASLLMMAICHDRANAQAVDLSAPPPIETIDANGVDLFAGSLTITIPGVSIGDPAAGGLAYSRTLRTSGVRDSFEGTVDVSGSTYTVSVNGETEQFTKSGSTYTPVEQRGSSFDGTTYIDPVGNVATFMDATNMNMPYGSYKVVSTFTRPDGVVLTFNYVAGTFTPSPGVTATVHRLQSVTTNAGYMLYLVYAASTITGTDPSAFLTFTKIQAVNRTTSNCLPTSLSCSLLNAPYTAVADGAVTDANNGVTQYSYNSYGIVNLTRPGSTAYDLTSTHNTGTTGTVKSVTLDGVTTSYTYADSGNVRTTTVMAPGAVNGRIITFDIPTLHVLSSTDEFGNKTTYAYYGASDTAPGRLKSVTQPEHNVTTYTYDVRGNVLTTVTKSKDGSTSYTSSATYGEGPTVTTCSNRLTCNQPATTTDIRGKVTNYSYSGVHGGIMSSTPPAVDGVSPQTRYTYAQEQAYILSGTSAVAAGPKIWKLISTSQCQTGAAAALTAGAHASCEGTADEVETDITYGPATGVNNLLPTIVKVSAGDGSLSASTATTYDDVGNVRSVDGPLSGTGDTTWYRYDVLRRRTGAISPDPDGSGSMKAAARETTYNPDGTVAAVDVGSDSTPSATGWGGFTSVDRQEFVYASGRKVRSRLIDESGSSPPTKSVTQWSYDTRGRPDCTTIRMTQADYDTDSEYNALPAACSLKSNGDRVSRTTYDLDNRPLTSQVLDGTTSSSSFTTVGQTSYTANGKTASVKDGRGYVTGYVYDGFDRLAETDYPGTAHTACTSSAGDCETITYTVNSSENMTLVVGRDRDYDNRIEYWHDDLGRLRKKARCQSGETNPTYYYDNFGRVKLISNDSGSNTSDITYTWDALGHMLSEAAPVGTMSWQWYLDGTRKRLTWPDGYYVTYDYDMAGHLLHIKQSGTTTLATFAYDDLGRRTSLTRGNGTTTGYHYNLWGMDGLTLGFPADTGSNESVTFQRNPAGQIVQRAATNDTYSWDQAGNTGNVNRPYAAANALNQYTSIGNSPTAYTYSYDTHGNLTKEHFPGATGYAAADLGTFAYTSDNLMKSARVQDDPRTGSSAANTTTFAYDNLNRLQQTVSGPAGGTQTTTSYGYDGQEVVATYNSAGTLTTRYVRGPWPDEPLVQVNASGGVAYFSADERGSLFAASNASGVRTAVDTYDEFGIPSNPGLFAYDGQMYLVDLGMSWYKARVYSPTLGRFMQTDPSGYGDGANWYNYAHGDPINGTDPSGEVDLSSIPAQYRAEAAYEMSENISHSVGGGGYSLEQRVLDDQAAGFDNSVLMAGATFQQWQRTANYEAVMQSAMDAAVDATGSCSSCMSGPDEEETPPDNPLGQAAIAGSALFACPDCDLIAGGIRALEAAEGSSEAIVIGEGMADRVIPTAEANGASFYNPPEAPPEQWMQNNQDWINQKMDQGCTILDCGAAPGRANYPNPTSPYYQMELDQIMGRGYQNYSKIPAVGE